MKLDIPNVLTAKIVVEGQPFELQTVLVVQTDLETFRGAANYDEEAFDAMVNALVEVMKENPSIDSIRVDSQHA